jgi:hypothetical protein
LNRFRALVLLVNFAPLPVAHTQGMRQLGAATAEFGEPFSSIDGVRELRDGRVIVLDSRDRSILLVDLRANTRVQIGREGSGPNEYRIPHDLLALPGDSAAFRDIALSNSLRIITPVRERPGFAVRTSAEFVMGRVQPAGVDNTGRFYGLRLGQTNVFTDSAAIVRWARGSAMIDTVGMISVVPVSPLYRGPPEMLRGPDGSIVGYRPLPIMPFRTANQWAVSRDGRVAIVTADPYRVDLIVGTNRVVRGPPIPWDRVPVTEDDREEYRTAARTPRASFRPGGSGRVTAGAAPSAYRDPAEWPKYLPPFLLNAVSFSPDGMLWVQRAVGAGSPGIIDVIDDSATLLFRLRIAVGERLVGFGESSVYMARVDDDGLQHLRRYQLPGRAPSPRHKT